jgi:hypothetical protein
MYQNIDGMQALCAVIDLGMRCDAHARVAMESIPDGRWVFTNPFISQLSTSPG